MKENHPARIFPSAIAGGARLLGRLAILWIPVILWQFPFQGMQRAAAQAPPNPSVLLQACIEKLVVDGDPKAAIEICQRVYADTNAPRDLRSRALLRIAECDRKLGQQARQVYERVAAEFPDLPAAAEARKQLATLLAQQEPPSLPGATTLKRIEWAHLGAMDAADTDGRRAVYASGDNLYFGDIDGRSKRLVLKTRRFEWVPCRDFSLVLLDLHSTPTRQHTLGVIRTDGTGYRALIRDDAKNSIFERDEPFAMTCSWDDRNALLSNFSPKSTIAGQLWLVSMADGERRVLVDLKGSRIRKAVFSPDGRYAAYEVWPMTGAAATASEVYVVPVEGGEPRLAYESTPGQGGNALLDWTADGRNLMVANAAKGGSALYRVPMNQGAPAGLAAFVLRGEFDDGYMTAAGGMVFEDKNALPSGADAMLATWDQGDQAGEWRGIDLNTNGLANPWPSFSPDGKDIAYVAQDADPSYRDVSVRNLSSGKERQIYRAASASIACQFSPRNAVVFCTVEKGMGDTDLVSIGVESSAVETIATFSGSRSLYSIGPDEKDFFFAAGTAVPGVYAPPFFRWNRSTRQETSLEPAAPDQRLISISPDGTLLARLLDGVVSIRSVNGGEWRSLASGVAGTIPPFVTLDRKWVLYQAADSTGKSALFRAPVEGGHPERLRDLPNNSSGFFFSPDGRQVLAVTEKSANYGLWLLENFVPSGRKEGEP